MRYLKSKQYYADLYDQQTIDLCKEIEKVYQHLISTKYKDSTPQEITLVTKVAEIRILYMKGIRYVKKNDVINDWMYRDRELDKKIEQARIPANVKCFECGAAMNCVTKDIYRTGEKKFEKVLFFFQCTACKKRRGIFEDNEKYIIKKLCPNCSNHLMNEDKKTDEKIICIDKCPQCGYESVTELNLDIEVLEKEEQAKQEQFIQDQVKYGVSDDKAEYYITAFNDLKKVYEFGKQIESAAKNKALDDKLKEIRRLKIAVLETHLVEIFEKNKFVKLRFDEPDTTRGIIVSFTVQDCQEERDEFQSKKALKKLLKGYLKDTNWKLMSNGISYQMGILSGKIKGVEDEEELRALVAKRFGIEWVSPYSN